MKKRIITLVLFLFFLNGFSQNLNYLVRSRYSNPIKKEKLNEAKVLSDLMPDYSANWIMSCDTVEILSICKGKTLSIKSTNGNLNQEQKNLLHTVDFGSEIIINLIYKYTRVHYSTTLIPEVEAEYAGGYQQMKNFLYEQVIDKISESKIKQLQQAIVSFIVNEDGEIANAQIYTSSGDQKIDNLLLDVINKMPKWKPAENSKGIKVKQEFEFSLGNVGC